MDDFFYQLQRMHQQLEGKDESMINPVEFGEIKGAVSSLQSQVTDLRAQVAGVNAKQDVIINQLSEAKGGWKVMMLLGGSAGAFGAAIASFFSKGTP